MPFSGSSTNFGCVMAAIKWREIDGRKGGGEIKSHNRMWGGFEARVDGEKG